MTINERIKLNKSEYYQLFKSYIDYIIEGILYGHFDIKEIRLLFNKLKEYNLELEDENYYLSILDSIDSLSKEEEKEAILGIIDRLNEDIYNYYEGIGDDYPYPDNRRYALGTNRSVPKLKDKQELIDRIKGLQLTIKDIEEYYNNSIAYQYAIKNAKVLNAHLDIGMYGVTINDNNGIINSARMIVPPVTSIHNALINVHEIRHMIDLYDYIGKAYPEENDFEERARNEEKKFIKEYIRNK